MTFILGLLAVIAGATCLVLCVVILLQEPKGGGLAAALGGSGMEAIGVNTGQVNRFTAWAAGIWLVALLLHAMLMPLDSTISGVGTGGGDAADTPADTQPSDAATPGGNGNEE